MNISGLVGKIKKKSGILLAGGLMSMALSSCATTPSYSVGELKSPAAIDGPQQPNGQVSDFWNPDVLEGNEALIYPYHSHVPLKGDGLLLRGPSEDWRNYRQPTTRARIYTALSKDFFKIQDCAFWKAKEKPTDKKKKGVHGDGLNERELQLLMQTLNTAAAPQTPFFQMPVVLADALNLIDGLPHGDPTRVGTAKMVEKMARRYWKISEILHANNPDFENPFQMRLAYRWKREVNRREYITTARGDRLEAYGSGHTLDKAYRDLDNSTIYNDMAAVQTASELFLSYAGNGSQTQSPVKIEKEVYKETLHKLQENPTPENLLSFVVMQAQLPAQMRLPNNFVAKQISDVGIDVARGISDYTANPGVQIDRPTRSLLNNIREELSEMNSSILETQKYMDIKTSMLMGDKESQRFHRALEKGAQKLMVAMDKAGQVNPLEKFRRQQNSQDEIGLG